MCEMKPSVEGKRKKIDSVERQRLSASGRVPHPFAIFLAKGWETTISHYVIPLIRICLAAFLRPGGQRQSWLRPLQRLHLAHIRLQLHDLG